MKETAVIALGLGVALGLLGTIDLTWAAFGAGAMVMGIIGGGLASLHNTEIPSLYAAIKERSRTADEEGAIDEHIEDTEKHIEV